MIELTTLGKDLMVNTIQVNRELNERPCVGIALIVRKDNKILLHKRKGKHAPGTWSCPGGHLEMWEEFAEAALRELKEEAGPVEITEPKFLAISNTMFRDEGKHSITIFVLSDWLEGEPQVTEPEKCESWEWFDYDNLPAPLMLGVQDIKDRGILESILDSDNFYPRSWRSDKDPIQIDLCSHGKFAIRKLGYCLNKNCEWQYESLPSSRTEEFLSMCRFDSFEEAVELAKKSLAIEKKNEDEIADFIEELKKI